MVTAKRNQATNRVRPASVTAALVKTRAGAAPTRSQIAEELESSIPLPQALKILSDSLRNALIELYDEYFTYRVLDGLVHFYIEKSDKAGAKFMSKVIKLADEAQALENGFRSIFSSIELPTGILYEMDIRFVESLHRYKMSYTKPCSLVTDLKEIYKNQSLELLEYIRDMKPSKKYSLPIIINAEQLPNCEVEIYRDLDIREVITVEAFQLNLDHVVSLIKQAKLKLDIRILSFEVGRGLLIQLVTP